MSVTKTPDLKQIAKNAQEAALNAMARARGQAPKDPLDALPDFDTAEEESKAEMEAVRSEYANRITQQRKRVADAIDTEYWFAAYFRSREQKEAFLKAIGVFLDGDKYLDGELLARRLGVDVSGHEATFTVRKPDPKFVEIAEE